MNLERSNIIEVYLDLCGTKRVIRQIKPSSLDAQQKLNEAVDTVEEAIERLREAFRLIRED